MLLLRVQNSRKISLRSVCDSVKVSQKKQKKKLRRIVHMTKFKVLKCVSDLHWREQVHSTCYSLLSKQVKIPSATIAS